MKFADKKEIVQFSIQRSGSTLIYQVLKELYPDKGVRKNHDWKTRYNELPAVCTYRDFRDVAASSWRTAHDVSAQAVLSGKRRMTSTEVVKWARFGCDLSNRYLPHFKKNGSGKIIWLQYEKFYNDFDWLLDRLEEFFDDKYETAKRDYIAKKCSRAQNEKIAKQMLTFKKYDDDSFIHGNHIMTGEPGSWKLIVPASHHKVFNDTLKPSLEKWGY